MSPARNRRNCKTRPKNSTRDNRLGELQKELEAWQKQLRAQQESLGAEQSRLEARAQQLEAAHGQAVQRVKLLTEALAEEAKRRKSAEREAVETGRQHAELEA